MPSGFPSSRLPSIKSKTAVVDDGENNNNTNNLHETSSEADTTDDERRLESYASNSSNNSSKDLSIGGQEQQHLSDGSASTASYLKQSDNMDSPRKRKRMSSPGSIVDDLGESSSSQEEPQSLPSSSSSTRLPGISSLSNSASSIPVSRRHSFMGKPSNSNSSTGTRSEKRGSIFSIFQKKEHNTIAGDSTTIEIDRAFEAWLSGEESNKETKQSKKDKKAFGSTRRRFTIVPSEQPSPPGSKSSKQSRRNSALLPSEVSAAIVLAKEPISATSSPASPASPPTSPPLSSPQATSPSASRQGSVIRKSANSNEDLFKQNVELKLELEKSRQEIAQWEKKYNELLQINAVLQAKLSQSDKVEEPHIKQEHSSSDVKENEKDKESLGAAGEKELEEERKVEESVRAEEATLQDKGKEEDKNETPEKITDGTSEGRELEDEKKDSKETATDIQEGEKEENHNGAEEIQKTEEHIEKEETEASASEQAEMIDEQPKPELAPVTNVLFGIMVKQFGLPPKRAAKSGTEQPRDISYLMTLHERLLRQKEVEQFYKEPSLAYTVAQNISSLEKTSSSVWMSVFEDSLQKLRHKEHRVHVAMEILKTEKTYVGHISILLHVFLHPLKQAIESGQPIISKEEVKNIFYQLEVIYGYNNTLLHSLEERINGWVSNGEVEKPLLLGDLFLEMAAFLQTYSSYINNYTTALQTLSVCSKNQLFVKFLQSDQVIQALGHKMDSFMLKDYLILPIQRIPRYIMLLENLLKHTEQEHPDYKNITKALKKVQVVADQNHKTQLDIENTSKVFSIQKLLNYRLVETNRRWIKDGEIFVFDFKTSQIKFLLVYLFNDIIVLAKKSGTQLKHLKTLPVVLMRVEEGCFDKPFKDRERENQTKVLTKAGASTTHGFRVISSAGTFLLCPKSAEIKHKWIQALNSAIDSVSVVVKPFDKRASVTIVKSAESEATDETTSQSPQPQPQRQSPPSSTIIDA